VADFAGEVEEVVERRLDDLGLAHERVTAAEAEARSGRRPVSDPAFQYAVEVNGTPAVLTVTPLTQEQADDYGPVLEVTHEVERLQRLGRAVPYHQVIVAPRGSVMLDLVGPEGRDGGSFESAGMEVLQTLLDHQTVRPLLG
jgi:hypothetical protein